MNTGDVYLPTRISEELACAFLRLSGSPRVMFQVKIADGSRHKFDKHRLAVVFFDGQAQIDFCFCQSLNQMTIDSSPPWVSFSFSEKVITGVVWHGRPREGTGVIGKLLETNEIMIKVYFDDYSSEDFAMEPSALANLQQCVRSDILHL